MSKYSGNNHSKYENDNHSNQLNPSAYAYWSSRSSHNKEDNEYEKDETDSDKVKPILEDEDINESDIEGDIMFVKIPAESVIYYTYEKVHLLDKDLFFNIGKAVSVSIKEIDDDVFLNINIPGMANIQKKVLGRGEYFEVKCEMFRLAYSNLKTDVTNIYIPMSKKSYVDNISKRLEN